MLHVAVNLHFRRTVVNNTQCVFLTASNNSGGLSTTRNVPAVRFYSIFVESTTAGVHMLHMVYSITYKARQCKQAMQHSFIVYSQTANLTDTCLCIISA